MNVLTRVSLPELAEVTGSVIISGTNMTEINCPKLAAAGTIYLIGAALTVADFPKLKTITASLNVQSPALTTLDGLSALEEVPSISISGARALTSIAGLHALKSAGTMSFYNAESLTEMDLRGISLDRLSISGTTWNNLRRIAADDEFAGRLDFSVQNVAALPAIEGFRRVGRLTMSAYGVAALDLPLLEKVEEELSFSSSDGVLKTINLPNLKSAGSLIIVATETLNVPKLETVGGGVSISLMPDIAVLEFPKLKSIVGQLYINNSNNTQDRPLHSISFPVLESIGAKLTFNNSYAAAAFPNFTNLDGFAALRSVQGVTITRFANLVDFTGLKNAIPSFTRYDWNVTNCGYNPTYQDMLE
jgi:hypothetical protein